MTISSTMTSFDDASIIRGFLSGEAGACARIDSWILSVIRSGRWNFGPECEDIYQDVLRRLIEALRGRRFKARSSLKTYVCRMAMYVCIDEYRRRRRRAYSPHPIEDLQIPDPTPGPLEQLDATENRKILEQVVAKASPECRDLWRMVYSEEVSYEIVAKRMGVAVGTVKSRAARCREKARRLFQKMVEMGNRDRGQATI